MDMNKIAIIGSEGFVGTNLINRLNKSKIPLVGYDKRSNNKANQTTYLDVSDKKSFREMKDIDVIINLAAEHRDDIFPISRYDHVNVKGAENVCDAA